MVGIIIVCVVVLILTVLLRTPVQTRFTYDQGDLAAWIQYGPVKLQIYPFKEKTERKPHKKNSKKAKKKKKSKAKINQEQILYCLDKLPPILGRALRRTRRRIRLNPLKIHLLIASVNPADTALLYGKLQAALAAGLPALHRLVRVQEQDIQLFLDFAGDRMDCIADVGIAIRPWDILSIAIRAGASLLKWLIGFKRLATRVPEGEKNTATEAA